MMTTILSSVISAVVCVSVYILITRYVTKKNLKSLREAARKEAEAEGEMIKKEKILQAKEKFIQLKSEHDRQVNERNQKVAQMEQRAKELQDFIARFAANASKSRQATSRKKELEKITLNDIVLGAIKGAAYPHLVVDGMASAASDTAAMAQGVDPADPTVVSGMGPSAPTL